MPLAKVFTEAGVDAETALIKSILERHGVSYSMHDVRKPEEAARAERLTKRSDLRVPFVLLGRKTVWLGTEMPELESAGSLKLTIAHERQLKHAAAEYTRGLLHLRGQWALGRDPRAAAFAEALERVLRDLAQQIVRDGEGATKLVAVTVTGAKSARAAKKVGLAIANSPLVKTAIAGEDPNWGRIVMAVGKSGEVADRDLLSIRFGDITVAEAGWVSPSYQEADGAAYMKRDELEIGVDLGVGAGSATVWTCDLTKRYIEINADYRS